MNESQNQNQSWDESLRSADPFLDAPNDIQQKNQIFQEITMDNDATQQKVSQPDLLERASAGRSKPSRLTRPLVAMSSAAAVVTVSLLGFSLVGSPSASAQMLEAAQNSVSATEGEIVVTAELEATAVEGAELDPELVSQLGVIEGTLDFDFVGEDYSFEASIDGNGEDFSPQARFVDGNLYASERGDSWFALGAEESSGFAQFASDYVPGVQNFNGEALEQLVLITDDISEAEVDGVITYTGMVETEKILALGVDEVPAAVLPFQLAEQQQVPLPTQLRVELAVVDGVTETITVTVDDQEIDGVMVSGTVTTDYSGVGETQEIVAPVAESIQAP